jgi:hypothetical protein
LRPMCRFLSPLLRSNGGVMSAPHAAIETFASIRSFLVIPPSLVHVANRPTHFLLRLARFAFALEYEPLGLAPSQDDRTARDSVGEPRRVRPAFVACGAPEVAVPAEVAVRRVARHGVGT